LTGNEVIALSDNPVAAAEAYYRENLQGTSMPSKAGDIRFSATGRKKIRGQVRVDKNKAQLVAAIKDIISNATYEGRHDLHKVRKDNIVAFHYFTGAVKVGNDIIKARIDVGEDSKGNLFYFPS